MGLPINIDGLMNGGTVEWERIEFKKGWNPVPILHTICAFANDFNNWGGGYIIIGVEEKDGRPVFPPVGLTSKAIDIVQKELLGLCHRIRPNYFPLIEPVSFMKRSILIIWVPGGTNRPYKAPGSLKRDTPYHYYLRRFSSTKKASVEEERELLRMANQVPFDDQINQKASLTDLNLTLIKAYLAKVGSALATETDRFSFLELCRRMNLVEGPDEYLKPKNVGLLMFNENPSRFFPGTQIDIVQFEEASGDRFREKIFRGPIHQQLIEALNYIQNSVIIEAVRKRDDRPEADRYFNYPMVAVEEALVNAVYHKSYQDDSPIEVRVYDNRLVIVSYPGPLPPLNKNNLMADDLIPRKYRNRRIGEFFKELNLTEGRGTGFPKIKKSMAANGSPSVLFETDDERTYFISSFRIHPLLAQEITIEPSAVPSLSQVCPKSIPIQFAREILFSITDESSLLGLMAVGKKTNRTRFRKEVVIPLIEADLIEMTIPDKPRSSKQMYRMTRFGKLALINDNTQL